MSNVIKVHQLPRLLAHPDDIRAESLRAILRAAPARTIIEDAQTGERFVATVVGRRIDLASCGDAWTPPATLPTAAPLAPAPA